MRSKSKDYRKKIISKVSTPIILAAFMGITTLTTPHIAWAQDSAEIQEVRQFSAKAGQLVNYALISINNGQHENAIAELSEALSIVNLNQYEKSTIYQMRGMSHYELKRMDLAINDLEQAISAGGFLPNEISALRINIAQLNVSEGQYAIGAQMLEDWERNGGQLTPKHIELLYQAWVQAEDYSRALPWAEKWFKAANPKERKHFDALNFLYANLGMEGRRADIIKEMVAIWPKEIVLWKTWILLLEKGGRGEEAFELQKILYLGGNTTEEKEILALVYAYERYGMPYQAARLLEREMNAGRVRDTLERHDLLKFFWREARDYKKALSVMEAKAELSGRAIDYYRLGEGYVENNQCVKAEALLKKLPLTSRAQYSNLLGGCYYDLSQKAPKINCVTEPKSQLRYKLLNKASRSFGRASKIRGDKVEAMYNRWAIFVDGELRNYDDRYCHFLSNVPNIDTCYIAIRLEYDEMFLTSKFELDDKRCMRHKPTYDRLFRTQTIDKTEQ